MNRQANVIFSEDTKVWIQTLEHKLRKCWWYSTR